MNNLFIDDNVEKVKFICSIKNCKKGIIYKIVIINKEKSLGDFTYLETNELKNDKECGHLNFEELKDINYNFNERQLINIQIIKKEFKNYEYNYNSYQRLTCMASIINSNDSIYERKINENDNNSEILSIRIEQNNNIFLSEIYEMSINYSKFSIFEFFNKGSKLKFHFLFDFSNENKDNTEFLKSINIFNDILLYCYNNYHLYTSEDEVYLYGIGAKRNNEDNNTKYFGINSGNNTNMVRTYKNAMKCFINCLNKIKREENIYIFPFLEYLFDEIKDDKKIYNVAILCLRNLSFQNDIEKAIDLIKKVAENNLPLFIIIIFVKDKNNINKMRDILLQEYSNLMYIETETKNNLENKLLYCFQLIGQKISKFTDDSPKNNRETIISKNLFDGGNCDDNNDDNENSNKNYLNNMNDLLINEDKKNSRRILNNSNNPYLSVNKPNPYLENKNQNNTIKESENESESTEKENKIMKNNELINPYSNFNNKEKNICNSNQRTDSDSYNNNNQYQNSFIKGFSKNNA